MTNPLPKWIQKRYAILWKRFRDKEFTFEEAEGILPDNKGIHMFFSDLRKHGWLDVRLDEQDTRKRVYKLKNPLNAFGEMEK